MHKKDFGKKSMPRNLRIAELMRRVGYIEQFGIRNMRMLVKQAGLPPIRFVVDNFFTVILRRNRDYDSWLHIIDQNQTKSVCYKKLN